MTLVAVAESRRILDTVVTTRVDLSTPHAVLLEGRRGHLRVAVTRTAPIAGRPGAWCVQVFATAGTLAGRRVLVARATTWSSLCERAEQAWREALAEHRTRLALRCQAEAIHAQVWREAVGAPESIEAAVLACVGGAA